MFNYYKNCILGWTMTDIKVNKDNSEIITYDETGIPIFIRERYLSTYPDYRALCHWHEDIEFIYIVEGRMSYYINGKKIILKEGNSIMINSGQLHYGYSDHKEECRFYCIILHPSLLTTNKTLSKRYIEPVTQNHTLDYLLFEPKEEAASILKSVYQLKTSPSPSYELEVIGLFHMLWKIIYKIGMTQYSGAAAAIDEDLQAQRQMVSYIYQNYSSNISLDDIAAAGKVCRSKCCQIFKKYVKQSPMDFVNAYRLECSQHLLSTTALTITDICTACGFNHLSYFSKQFQAKYGCTPRNYRKTIR